MQRARHKIDRPHGARRRTAVVTLLAAVLVGLTTLLAPAAPVATSRALFTSSASDVSTFSTATLASPSSPTILRSGDDFIVSWTATPSTYADGYVVSRGSSYSGPWTDIATVTGRTNTSFTDTTPMPGANVYRVISYEAANWKSTPITLGMSNTMAAPTGLAAQTTSAVPDQVTYTWNPVAGANHYELEVKRCDNSGCGSFFYPATAGLTYTFSSNPGSFYDVRVRAVDNLNTAGPWSNLVQAKNVPVMGALNGDVMWDGTYGTTERLHRLRVLAGWNTSNTIEAQYQIDGGTWAPWGTLTVTSDPLFQLHKKLSRNGTPPGHTYTFRVRGCNNSGCSAWTPFLGPSRIPYNAAVLNDAFWTDNIQDPFVGQFYHRATKSVVDYQWVGMTGTEGVDFTHNQCPSFRSCAGTDKSVLLSGAVNSGAGYFRRSWGFGDGNLAGGIARTWEFAYRQNGAFVPGAGFFHQAAADGAPSSVNNTSWRLWTGSTAGQLIFGDTRSQVGGLKYADGNWHLYHVTYDGVGTVRLYEDGALAATWARTVNTNGSSDVYLGAMDHNTWPSSNFVHARGWYDEWAVYRYAMTPTQIARRWASRADGD